MHDAQLELQFSRFSYILNENLKFVQEIKTYEERTNKPILLYDNPIQ